MRWMFGLLLVAAVGIAALFYLLGDDGDAERRDTRSGAHRGGADVREEPKGGGAGEGGAATARGALPAGDRLVKVVLQTADGSPAEGATLVVGAPDGSESVRDAARGEVELRDVAPGIYRLLARRGDAVGGCTLTVEDERVERTIVLREAIVVAGRVLDARGRAIAGAVVEGVHGADRSARRDFTSLIRLIADADDLAAAATCDDEGRYRLLLPGAGSYALRAMARGYGQEGVPTREYREATTGLDIHLFPAASVLGRVTDADGVPVAAAHVQLVHIMATLGAGEPKVETYTDAAGRFRVDASTAWSQLGGGMLLRARAAGYAVGSGERVAIPADDVHIVLERGAVFRLRTMDADVPGKPVPGVHAVVVSGQTFMQGETDERGELRIEHMPAPGARTRSQLAVVLTSDTHVSEFRNLRNVTAVDGLVDAGDIEMERGGVVRGVVRDKVTGEPVARAVVQSLGGLARELQFVGANSVQADDEGRFELRGVPLKATGLFARHRDYPPDLDLVRQLMGRSRESGSPLFAEGAREVTQDVLLVPGATVRGVVRGPDGAPVAGAEIGAEGEAISGPATMMYGGGPPRATSDETGAFALGPLAAGQEITLVASHSDFGASEPAKTKVGGEAAIELRLRPALSVTGQVVDEKGAPIAGARVTFAMGPQREFGPAPRPAITGDDGRFVLRNVPRVAAAASVSHPRYIAANAPVAPGDTDAVDVGTIRLESGLQLSGVALDPDGKPIVGAPVHCVRDADPNRGNPNVPHRTSTSEDGRFHFHALEPGEYTLSLYADGHYAEPVHAAAGAEGVEIRTQKSASLSGRVVDERGQAVSGASVTGQTEDGKRQGASTDDDGRFRIDPLPPSAVVTLQIRHRDYLLFERASVPTGSDATYTLDAGRVIHGVVTNEKGGPAVGAFVIAHPGAKSAAADEEGKFTLSGLPRADVTVTVLASGAGYARGEPVVVGAGESTVRLQAKLGLAIEGTIEMPQGVVHAGTSIRVVDANDNTLASTFADEKTLTFRIQGVPPGKHRIQATRYESFETREHHQLTLDDVEAGAKDVVLRFAE